MTLAALLALGTRLYTRFALTSGEVREILRQHWNEIQRTGLIPLGYRATTAGREYTWVVISKGRFDDDAGQFRHIQEMTPIDAKARILRV